MRAEFAVLMPAFGAKRAMREPRRIKDASQRSFVPATNRIGSVKGHFENHQLGLSATLAYSWWFQERR